MVLAMAWTAHFNLTTPAARLLGIGFELLTKGSRLALAFTPDLFQASLQRFDLFLLLVDHRLQLLKQRPAIQAIGSDSWRVHFACIVVDSACFRQQQFFAPVNKHLLFTLELENRYKRDHKHGPIHSVI